MAVETFKEKISKLASEKKSGWEEKAKWRKANRHWLLKSGAKALRILGALKEKELSQIELARLLFISPQQVNKIVKGQENLTLTTICKIEQVLGIELINVETFAAVKDGKKNIVKHSPE